MLCYSLPTLVIALPSLLDNTHLRELSKPKEAKQSTVSTTVIEMPTRMMSVLTYACLMRSVVCSGRKGLSLAVWLNCFDCLSLPLSLCLPFTVEGQLCSHLALPAYFATNF